MVRVMCSARLTIDEAYVLRDSPASTNDRAVGHNRGSVRHDRVGEFFHPSAHERGG